MQTIRIQKIISQAGLEVTNARLKVLEVCVAKQQPLSVTEVAKIVGSDAHLATIYRVLEKFVSVGLLERINFQEGKFRYEYVNHHHHHAVCQDCGKVEEVQDQSLEQATSQISLNSGFLITKHAIELYGYCQGCQPKGSHAQ